MCKLLKLVLRKRYIRFNMIHSDDIHILEVVKDKTRLSQKYLFFFQALDITPPGPWKSGTVKNILIIVLKFVVNL